jgi:hypothetical protein
MWFVLCARQPLRPVPRRELRSCPPSGHPKNRGGIGRSASKRDAYLFEDEVGRFDQYGEYPFNKRYGWVSDRFGVSWQVGMAM